MAVAVCGCWFGFIKVGDMELQSFGDLPEKYADRSASRVSILPIPYDGTSTWIKGADAGPAALL